MSAAIFLHSTEIPRDEVHRPGSKAFTTMPVRRNNRDDIADAGSFALVRDWELHVQDGNERLFHGCVGPSGNYNSYMWPECLPERLGILSYLNSLSFLHDDLTELMSVDAARAEHDAFASALEMKKTPKESRERKITNLVPQMILELFKVGRDEAMELVELCSSGWLRVTEHDDPSSIQTLDEYMYHRKRNAGVRSFWNILLFSMDMRLSPTDEAMVAELKEIATWQLALTNDYFSWQREQEQAINQGDGRIMNSVWFMMSQHNVSESESLERVKTLILESEAEYLLKKESLLQSTHLPSHVRRWIEVCAVVMGSYHYWCSTCPRHNDWHSAPPNMPEHIVDITGLIGLASISPRNAIGIPSPMSDSVQTPNTASHVRDRVCSRVKRPLDIDEYQRNPSTMKQMEGARRASEKGIEHTTLPETLSDKSLVPITAPIKYLSSLPSKGVRTMLFKALNTWLDVPPSTLTTLTDVVNNLHTSSLMLDDIQDNSPLRRGSPSAHKIFGTGQTINSASYLYTQATAGIHKLNNPAMMTVFLEELQHLFVGQSWDLYWTFHSKVPTCNEYLEMVSKKTGGFLRMIMRLCLLATTNFSQDDNEDFIHLLSQFTNDMGIFFQVRDDYMNLVSADYSSQKGFAEDLDEGKLSYPLILAITDGSDQSGDQLLGILRESKGAQKTTETKRYLIKLMEDAGALRKTLEFLIQLERDMEARISKLEVMVGVNNPLLRVLVKTLSVAHLGEGKME
ncbi:isoprenoid synthase domain-containing protein [Podospora australis]|uniref:Isoprenoid synthase domain-containing protein n=1 Tax=Podospora australis TaxID=1536484 RepID=A0AAN7AFX1_9PEZI|nr:isoprenoid synthase domain-containing protein [Podospora australis]